MCYNLILTGVGVPLVCKNKCGSSHNSFVCNDKCDIPHRSFANKPAGSWFWLIVCRCVRIMCVPSFRILLQANLQVGGVVLVGGMPVGRKGKEGSVTSKVTRFEICNKASHCFDGVIMSFTIHECYACNIKQALSSTYSGRQRKETM